MTTTTILSQLPFATPTQEQENALLAIQSFVSPDNNDDFCILSGAAGTGKTSITTAIVNYLIQEEIAFSTLAPTGRAARIIGSKSGVHSNTIHSKIYNVSTDSATGRVYFRLKDIPQKDKCPTIFIVDESSMINAVPNTDSDSLFHTSNALLDDIVAFVKKTSSESKVLFLGDSNQLAPIGENTSRALQIEYLRSKYSWQGQLLKLTQVMRQQEESEIIKNAVRTREGIDAKATAVKIYAKQFESKIYGAATHYTQHFLNNGPDDAIVIGCTHKSNMFFNELVRTKLYGQQAQILMPNDYMLVTQAYERNGVKLYAGDHVTIEAIDWASKATVADAQFVNIRAKAKNLKNESIMIQDTMRLDLINVPTGHRGLQIENKLRQERFKACPALRETKRATEDKYLGALKLTYGHAITCNKAQGGEWNKVYLNTAKIPDLKFQYTAITRAKEELLLF
jgi:exodeoxyribonuclease V